MRSIPIDQNTIQFLDTDDLENLKKSKIIQSVMPSFEPECEMTYTNLGLFRAYIETYLRNHPKIHSQMTLSIRLLEPSPTGLPLQIYVFTNDTEWANYEKIQAGIFEHLLAIMPLFKLRLFQQPSGFDLKKFLNP